MDLLTPNRLDFVKQLSDDDKIKFLNEINSLVRINYILT